MEDKQHQQGGGEYEYDDRRGSYSNSSDCSYHDSVDEDGDDKNEDSNVCRGGDEAVEGEGVEEEGSSMESSYQTKGRGALSKASNLSSAGYGGISSPCLPSSASLGSGVIEDGSGSSTYSFSPFNSLFTSASPGAGGEDDDTSSRRPHSASSHSKSCATECWVRFDQMMFIAQSTFAYNYT